AALAEDDVAMVAEEPLWQDEPPARRAPPPEIAALLMEYLQKGEPPPAPAPPAEGQSALAAGKLGKGAKKGGEEPREFTAENAKTGGDGIEASRLCFLCALCGEFRFFGISEERELVRQADLGAQLENATSIVVERNAGARLEHQARSEFEAQPRRGLENVLVVIPGRRDDAVRVPATIDFHR